MPTPGQAAVSASSARGRPPGSQEVSITWFIAGITTGGQHVHKYLERTDETGGVNIGSGATPVMVPFDREDHLDSDYFYAVASGVEDQIQVKRTGRYRLTYGVSTDTDDTANWSTTKVSVFLNGTSVSELVNRGQRYLYNRHSNRPEASCGATMILDLDADDILRIGGQQQAGSSAEADLVAEGSSVLLELIEDREWINPGGVRVAEFNGSIRAITMGKGTSGSAGSTYVDVALNGVSIVGSLGLDLDHSEMWRQHTFERFEEIAFKKGDVFTLSFPASLNTESPPATGITVNLLCRKTN